MHSTQNTKQNNEDQRHNKRTYFWVLVVLRCSITDQQLRRARPGTFFYRSFDSAPRGDIPRKIFPGIVCYSFEKQISGCWFCTPGKGTHFRPVLMVKAFLWEKYFWPLRGETQEKVHLHSKIFSEDKKKSFRKTRKEFQDSTVSTDQTQGCVFMAYRFHTVFQALPVVC